MAKRKQPEAGMLPFPTANPKEVFTRIRNFLAGRMLGATRDRSLLTEVIKCLLSFYLEADASDRATVHTDIDASAWYRARFARLRKEFDGLFSASDEIQLDPAALYFVHRQFETLQIDRAERDPIGDAYETFVGSAIRGEEGQFFTPLNAVDLLVKMIAPQPDELVVDPACGAGGFLVSTAIHWRNGGHSPRGMQLVGVDKDSYLAQLARARLTLLLRAPVRTECADSLEWGASLLDFPLASLEGQVDVVLTNPPFGVKIVSASDLVRREFELARKWKQGTDGLWAPTAEISGNTPPQVLFVERCIRLLKPGGRLGAIVPESLISGKSYRYVSEYLGKHGRIVGVVGLPEALFKTSGKGGTHTKTCAIAFEKSFPAKKNKSTVFFAEAKWCGHDSRGRTIENDDLPAIVENYRHHRAGKLGAPSRLGFTVKERELEPGIFAPRFYDYELTASLHDLAATHELVTVRDLVDAKELEISTGDEVGKLVYGTGDVPFVRTSDISTWEIKRDPKHLVSTEVYEAFRAKQDVQPGDLLMVKDGTYLIGTCAMVTRFDTRIVYQSHIYKLRLRSKRIDSQLMLAMLSSPIVQRQIKARCLSQDIIDSLGDRIYDLQLPIPRDAAVRARISEMVAEAIEDRIMARELSRQACDAVVNPEVLTAPTASAAAQRRGREELAQARRSK